MTNASRDRLIVLGVFFGAAALLLPGIGNGTLENSDEMLYASIARHMLEAGDLFDQSWHGVPVLHRPPLAFWLHAASMAVFGDGLLGLRLPAGLLAVLAIVFTFVHGRQNGFSVALSVASALLLMGLSLLLYNSRRLASDLPLTVAWLVTVCAYAAARRDRRWYLAVWAGLVLAFFSKGFVAGLLGILLLGDWFVRRRKEKQTLWIHLVGIGVALVLVMSWMLMMTSRHGDLFVSDFLGLTVISRATSNMVASTGPLFYVTDLARRQWWMAAIFGLGLAGSAWLGLRRRDGNALWLMAWAFVVIVPFSIAATRIKNYVLPGMPALALLALFPLRGLRWTRFRSLAVIGAALVVAVVPNFSAFVTTDHSPGLRVLARASSDLLLPNESVLVYNTYHLLADYETRGRAELVTDDPRYAQVLNGIPILERSKSVTYVPRRELPELLAHREPLVMLVERMHWNNASRVLQQSGRRDLAVLRRGRWMLVASRPERTLR